MKDVLFFTFIIFCLFISIIIADRINTFFPCQETTLTYSYDSPEKGKSYLQQTIHTIKKSKSGYKAYYTLTRLDKKQKPLISIPSLYTVAEPKKVTFNPLAVIPFPDQADVSISGSGLELPLPLTVGMTPKEGFINVSTGLTQTGYKITQRRLTQTEIVKTPEGSYPSHKEEAMLEVTSQGRAHRYHLAIWYTRGIGVIKSEITTLGGKTISNQELVHIGHN